VQDEEAIAQAVEAGTDRVEVPEALLDEEVRKVEASLIVRVRTMTVPERIKLALRGNREARMILVRDNNPVIRKLVMRNPRIGAEELLAIAQSRNADDELLRIIAEHRDWTANYQLRCALTNNPKTPIVIALRMVRTLEERDVRRLAKSKNVPGAVSSQAKRLLFNRPRG
jgi:hypothetical protein